MAVNIKVVWLLLGIIVGGVYGYVTRPASAEINIGGTSIEFSNNSVSTHRASESLTPAQGQHVALYAVIGGIVGLLVGFATDRRR